MTSFAASLLRLFRRSKLAGLAFKVALTLAAFWFVFRGVDFSHLADMAARQDHRLMLAVIAILFSQVILGTHRWRVILRSLARSRVHLLSLIEAFKIYYISMFFNNCLPGAVGGDVVRVWLTRSEHISLPLSINSVIIDRLVALAMVFVLVIVTLPLLGAAAGFNAMLVLPPVLALAGAGILFLFNIQRLLGRFSHIRVVHWLLFFASNLRLLFKHRVAFAATCVYAMLGQVIYCFSTMILARSLGIDISFTQCLTLIPPVVLATTLPISVGGWGIREAGMVTMLSLAGVSQAQALLLSIQLGLVSMIVSLPAGLLWLVYRKHASRPPADGIPLESVV